MKKSYSLKIISIMMLLAAMVRFIMGIMMFNFFSKSAILRSVPQEVINCAIAAFILIIVFVIALVICGFVGAICWDDPDIALKCTLFGLVTLALGVAGDWLQASAGYALSYPVWISSIVVPALYVIAALIFLISSRRAKKKKAAKCELHPIC